MRRVAAAFAAVLMGSVSVAGATGRRAAPGDVPPDAELLLRLDLLRESDLAKRRELYSKLSLFERLELLERLRILDLEAEMTPTRQGETKR